MRASPGILVLVAALASTASAQTRTIRVTSRILGEARVLHVSLPPNYALAKQRYQVTYLLDGQVRPFFDLVVASSGYDITGDVHEYPLPPQIVVGVDQRDRGADLGSNQVLFTRFLVEELVPYIDHEYRTAGYRTLIGHSLGGWFALMTFCRAPGVFPTVIAISPTGGDSTEMDNEIACLRQAFTASAGVSRQVVLSAGEREPRTLAGVQRLRDLLQSSAPPTWRWTVIDGTELGHTGTPFATIPSGIRFVQDAALWEMPVAAADSVLHGITDPDHAINAFYERLSARVGSPVMPSRKWLLIGAHLSMQHASAEHADEAVQRVIDAYPEDLEAYGMQSALAQRRGDPAAARRALEDARRMLEKLDFFDVYDRERKRQLIAEALASLPR